MGFKTSEVLKVMLKTGAKSFGGDWNDIKDLAKVEFKTLLTRIQEINKSVIDPNSTMTLAKGKILVKSQIDLAAQVIVGLTTMMIVAVQKAIRAVLTAVKKIINKGLGIELI